MNALSEFFANGQNRREWLDRKANALSDAAAYYLGPTGIPQKINALAGLAQYTDAGDMVEAADASRALWNDPTIANFGRYGTAAAAMMLPAVTARAINDGVDVAGDLARFGADESGALDLDAIRRQFPNAKIDVSDGRDGVYRVHRVVVPETDRGDGTGTAIMREILAQADADGAAVALSPSADFGGNVRRLREWYKSLGFKENKGRSRDFSISESMIRPPRLD